MNNINRRFSLLFILTIVWSPLVWSADGVFEKRLGQLFGGDSRPCAFFTLEGVAEATTAVPGSPYFVLPNTHPQFKETFSILLSAKISGVPVYIVTTGSVHACGHAEVKSVGLL